MAKLIAKVKGGRLLLDEPTDLPDGTEVPLEPCDEVDDLTDAERSALHAALAEGWRQAQAGQGVPAEVVLRELRSRE